ncbi:MAG: phospholipase D-like domain-containing protein [Woeseia sp.]
MDPVMQDTGESVLVPGRTCWRIEPADRFALIIDASEYFRQAKAAMLKARYRIMLIGWDFDVRIQFEPKEQTLEGPNRLGAFLSWLPKNRPSLRIYLLKWDLGVLQSLGRGMMPIFIHNWMTSGRLRFKLDSMHPAGAAHHQKIVVIDDAMAFCGGIDMTVDRWDTREHLDDHPCRVKPNGDPHGPWHDATTAIDGEAALAVGDLARERWRQATGEKIEPVPAGNDPWPDGLAPTIRNVNLGIARTLPELDDGKGVLEIEALYLKAIGNARRTVYLESQYFASRKIATALADRLREPDGPEIVLVLPQSAEGWLEQQAMDGARVSLFRMLWGADANKRFGAFYPVTERSEPIYVHAKIMVIDDTLLRVGSSNLNNRSMCFDTECDLAFEARNDSPANDHVREAIVAVQNDLLCEHLGVERDVFQKVLDDLSGSVLAAIGKLLGTGRSLKPFEEADVADDETALAENELLDPEQRSATMAKRLVSSFRDFASGLKPWQSH